MPTLSIATMTPVALALAALTTLPVAAAENSWTLAGGNLTVSSPCARTVDIVPSASAREITVSARAEFQEEIDILSVTSQSSGVTVTKQGNRCPFSLRRREETLRLTITLPAGGDLSVREGGSGDYQISVAVGRLDVRLSGSGELAADRVEGALDVSLSGSGGVSVRELAGQAARIHASGSGGAEIGGRIGQLEVDLSGSGGVSVAAANAASLETSGSGDISANSLNGSMTFDGSGSGGLTVGALQADSARIKTSGDGGVSIREGRVGHLQVSTTGSADARLGVTAEQADLSTTGSGDIDIQQVQGAVTQRSSGSGKVRIGKR